MNHSRAVLVTGANAGIGFAAAAQLVAAGCDVTIGCRNLERGRAAIDALREQVPGASVRMLQIDLASQQSIRDAVTQIERLDGIIHNAAYFDVTQPKRSETVDGIETTWATNHLGPTLLTHLARPLLAKSDAPRVVAVTSKGLMMFPKLTVDLDDPEYTQRKFTVSKAYYQSKLAHLAWMLHAAEHDDTPGIRYCGIRVTNVKIDTKRYPNLAWPLRAAYAIKSRFSISPATMAETYTWAMTSTEAPATGSYWDAPNVPAKVSTWASVKEHREVLMDLTRRQLGIL